MQAATAGLRCRIALSAGSDMQRLIVDFASNWAFAANGQKHLTLQPQLQAVDWAATVRILQLSMKPTGAVMNKDQVKGRVEEAKGKIKEVAGRTVRNPDLEDRGTIQKVGGAVQKNYGDLKENVKDGLKKQR